ncbi:MAG: hypothetical protein M1814_000395 [Vezdaea aestivalis]|nr:MAG: hypothetical protein M1814_000395 [Vezdaea aestivalis]
MGVATCDGTDGTSETTDETSDTMGDTTGVATCDTTDGTSETTDETSATTDETSESTGDTTAVATCDTTEETGARMSESWVGIETSGGVVVGLVLGSEDGDDEGISMPEGPKPTGIVPEGVSTGSDGELGSVGVGSTGSRVGVIGTFPATGIEGAEEGDEVDNDELADGEEGSSGVGDLGNVEPEDEVVPMMGGRESNGETGAVGVKEEVEESGNGTGVLAGVVVGLLEVVFVNCRLTTLTKNLGTSSSSIGAGAAFAKETAGFTSKASQAAASKEDLIEYRERIVTD